MLTTVQFSNLLPPRALKEEVADRRGIFTLSITNPATAANSVASFARYIVQTRNKDIVLKIARFSPETQYSMLMKLDLLLENQHKHQGVPSAEAIIIIDVGDTEKTKLLASIVRTVSENRVKYEEEVTIHLS